MYGGRHHNIKLGRPWKFRQGISQLCVLTVGGKRLAKYHFEEGDLQEYLEAYKIVILYMPISMEKN